VKVKCAVQVTYKNALPRLGVLLCQSVTVWISSIVHIYNAVARCNYWPAEFKAAQIIMVLKPEKDPTDVASYRPISLISAMSKLLEKLISRQIAVDTDPNTWIPHHQFGFRQGHSTLQQCHRITHTVNTALEHKQYCTAAFLDVSQAFDKVWHPGLLYKLKKCLPISYFPLFQSYLQDRTYVTKVNSATSSVHPIRSGVPQGSILGPLLYTIYTSDLPTSTHTVLSTFADDTAIVAVHRCPNTGSLHLQDHLNKIGDWLRKWRIKVNQGKSVHVTFTTRTGHGPPIHINQQPIPQGTSVKYLGMHLDNKLTWREHIIHKRKQLDLKTRKILWLLGRTSPLSLENKLLIYKTTLKPVWTYGIELWGCANKTNVAIIQRYQSKVLRIITHAPWYVSNQTLHTDLRMPYVTTVREIYARKHRETLEHHPNPEVKPLLYYSLQARRLKRRWTFDALH
jgi:hypothetical protein